MNYSGILNIDKPQGITSFTAVSKVKRILGVKKAGHSGTLDPLATGVLPIMVGSAVKTTTWLTAHDKRYFAGIELGLETDSEDITGKVISKFEGSLPSFEDFKQAAESFKGEVMQVPPMYSAIKQNGVKLVNLARQGVTVKREARKITIHSINASCNEGKFFLDISCSKGTYIRTLCADIGKKLSCGAVMSSLRRTAAGIFYENDSIPLEQISNMTPVQIAGLLKPTETVFYDLEKITFPSFFERLFKNGAPVFVHKLKRNDIKEGTLYRIYDTNGFFALGEAIKIDGLLAIKVKKFF